MKYLSCISNNFRVLVRIAVCVIVCTAGANAQLPSPALVGYWHNWNDNNAPYIHLDSLDPRYNVIEVAFALPASNTDMTMNFTPDRGTVADFVQRMMRVQAKGKKVLLSVGGATATIDLSTTARKTAFVNSMTTLLSTYGFDGMDIDIESGASVLVSGGTIENPQSVAQLNLIDAVRAIMWNFRSMTGKKMLLTMAPETAYIQGGMSGYGNVWGGYLPIVHALRDSLDLLQVQLYNSGTMYGIDRNVYTQGTADFIVAMTEAVIQGFTTNGGVFAGLPASKIAVGLPAATGAAGGGFTDSATVGAALRYLLGKGARPGQYTLVQSGGYPTLRGMMTWSVNWDATVQNRNRYAYANNWQTLFSPQQQQRPAKTVLVLPGTGEQLPANSVRLEWQPSTPSVTHYHLDLRTRRGETVLNDTSLTETTLLLADIAPASEFLWRVRAKNGSGWGDWSDERTFFSVPLPQSVRLIAPDSNAQLRTNTVLLQWAKNRSPGISEYRVVMMDESGVKRADTLVRDTILVLTIPPATGFRWRVQARNISGWGGWSAEWLFRSVPYPERTVAVLPANNDTLQTDTVTFVWQRSQPGVEFYRFELRTGDTVVALDSTVADTLITMRGLERGREYRWRVQARNISGWGGWSDKRNITIRKAITLDVSVGSAEDSLVVFPNPTDGMIHLRGLRSSALSFYDMLGVCVLRLPPVSTESISVDMSPLPSGVYLLQSGGIRRMVVKR